MKLSVKVRVNGEAYEEEAEPRTLLVQFLRERLGLTGTHIGCVVGECGACSVLVDGALVKSCLMLAVQANGRDVMTVEGLAQHGKLHPIQEAFVTNFALQCGYCTPGFLMASYAFLKRNPTPTEDEIRRDLSGNLCMCTGYVQIVEAVKHAALELAASSRSQSSRGPAPAGLAEAREDGQWNTPNT
jgi:aerobic carbon-monoxide dehydrogenase small subunit